MIKVAILFTLMICLAGCNTSGPTAAVKKRDDLAVKGDIDGVVSCYSSGYISRVGAEKVKDEALKFIELKKRTIQQTGHNAEMHDLKETISGDRSEVAVRFGDPGQPSGFPVTFHLIKENGEWKIDSISEAGGR